MEYWTKKLQACLQSGMQRIPARLANAVAVVAAVAVAASLVVTLSRTAADDQNRASAARMATAVATARKVSLDIERTFLRLQPRG